MNHLLEKENIKIENIIYNIRGKQVMIDNDLAKLYKCKNGTKEINQAVQRNIEKFPTRYCFRITDKEYKNLISQNVTSSCNEHGGSRKGHTVFTEQGVYMLATILKSKVATEVTISIMDTFVLIKNYISNDSLEKNYYKEMILSHDKDIRLLKEQFRTNNNHLFFEGQIYDAYSLMKEIMNLSKKTIVIIDNYVDKKLFDILAKTNKKILIITNNFNNQDYEKYKKQYSNVDIKINSSFHDRFIIIDSRFLYHCGASFKDLGKKCFAITLIEDVEILKNLLKKL